MTSMTWLNMCSTELWKVFYTTAQFTFLRPMSVTEKRKLYPWEEDVEPPPVCCSCKAPFTQLYPKANPICLACTLPAGPAMRIVPAWRLHWRRADDAWIGQMSEDGGFSQADGNHVYLDWNAARQAAVQKTTDSAAHAKEVYKRSRALQYAVGPQLALIVLGDCAWIAGEQAIVHT
jgi:hypothetical protein